VPSRSRSCGSPCHGVAPTLCSSSSSSAQVSSNSTGLIADGAKVWSPLCLEGFPDAGATVAGHHGQPDHELNDADQLLEDDIPRGAIHSQQPDEGRERSQEHGRHPPWPAGWKAERLVIDLRGRCQNDARLASTMKKKPSTSACVRLIIAQRG
jgi:hypothetical protein